MQFWGDIILHQPELIAELPKDIIALCWGYDADHPYKKQCMAFEKSKVDFYVCPGTSSWNSITGRTDNCLANMQSAAENGARHGASGYLITDWGDGGHHQTLPISYLGFTAAAAYSWHLKKNRDVDLAKVMDRIFFKDSTGIMGQFLIDLGRTLNQFKGMTIHNRSIINELLFRNLNSGKPDLSKVGKSDYARAEKWLDKLDARLADARPQVPDADLYMNECRHSLAMSRYALKRGRYYQFKQGSADQLRRDLQKLVMGHEEQWLARNRRGGLHESSQKLRGSADYYCS